MAVQLWKNKITKRALVHPKRKRNVAPKLPRVNIEKK